MLTRPFGWSTVHRRRLLLVPFALLLSLVVVAAGTAAVFNARYGSRVHPGVQVLGENLGGMERQQAIAAVESRARADMKRPVEFRLVTQTRQVSAGELGLSVDVARTVDRAFGVGRTEGAFDRWSGRYQVWRSGKQVAPVVTFDADSAREALIGMASTVNRPARDATLALTPNGPIIGSSQVGYELDTSATLSLLPSSLETLHAQDRPVATVIRATQPRVLEAQLTFARDAVAAASARPMRLSFQGRVWKLAPERVRSLVHLTGEGASIQPSLRTAPLRQWLQQVSADINRAPRNARIVVRPGAVTVVQSQVGYSTNVAATVQSLQAAAFAAGAPVSARVRVVRPAIGDADLQPEVREANSMVNRPLSLQFGSREWTLSSNELTALLRWKGTTPNRTPYLAAGPLKSWVRVAAQDIGTSPVNARIVVWDGLARVLSDTPGRQMDTQKTFAAVQGVLDDSKGIAKVTTVRLPAAVSAADLKAAAARASHLIGSPVSLTYQDETWTVDTATLRSWLYWRGEGKDVVPALDEGQVYSFTKNVGYGVFREPKSAYVDLEPGGLPKLITEIPDVDIDVDATARLFHKLAAAEYRSGEVLSSSLAPTVASADLQEEYDQISSWSSDRFYLTMDDDHTWWLDREDIAGATFWNNAGGAEIEPNLNTETMEEQIRRWVKAPSKTVIDYEQTAANVVDALERGDRSVAIEYSVIKEKPSVPRHVGDLAHWTGKFPKKWIDLDLTTQTIAAYEGKKQVKVSFITSGRPELATPTGTFSVVDKLSPYTFVSPWPKGHRWWYPTANVKYALRFRYDGLYIHDAPWRSEYGPGTNGSGRRGAASTGSHGCVNVPSSMMGWMYTWSKVGTQIIIHK